MISVDAAFAAVPRADFLPVGQRALADYDAPLPIGFGATNSQPWTVRYMLRLLRVHPGARVLDMGSGSGWTTALLAHLAGADGWVIGVDIVPELVAMAREHLGDRFPTARIEQATPGILGWPPAAPYDRILVSADGGTIPVELEDQLAPKGRMVIPAANHMWLVERDTHGHLHRRDTGDLFRFVPLR